METTLWFAGEKKIGNKQRSMGPTLRFAEKKFFEVPVRGNEGDWEHAKEKKTLIKNIKNNLFQSLKHM